MKRNSISEALRLARKRYADGGSPFYDQTIYDQLMRDIDAQRRRSLPAIDPLRVGYPRPNSVDYQSPIKDVPSTDALDKVGSGQAPPLDGGGGGSPFDGYDFIEATPQGIMSSTSTGPASSSGLPSFSFTGAPIGAVEAYDLPAPVTDQPLNTISVNTTSVAPTPGLFGNAYMGLQASTAQPAPTSTSPFGALVAPTPTDPVYDIMGNVAAPGSKGQIGATAAPPSSRGTVPGVQQPSFVNAPLATEEQLESNPDITGPTPAGAAFTAGMADQTISGETGSFNAAPAPSSSDVASAAPAAPAAPSAPEGTSPIGATGTFGMGVSLADPATMPADMATALAQAQDEADAQAAADAAAAAVEADATTSSSDTADGGGSLGSSSSSDSSSSDSSSSDSSSSSSDGDGSDGGGGDGGGGDGGGGEKRGGFVTKTPRLNRDRMVKKALDVSSSRKSKSKQQKGKSRSVVEQAVVVASKLANRQRGRP